jgi:polysaccharide export outer membrane protein
MKIRSFTSAFLPILFLLFSLPAAGGQKRTAHPGHEAVAPATAGQAKAATSDPKYVIGPQDVLDISVWNQPKISRTVPVRPDGKISLPLLDDVVAAGLTPEQLGEKLTRDLRKYLENPQVTVIVTAINSRRIFIVGEVGRAGIFPMLPNMTVLQALSEAGGFSPFAKLSGIYVLRNENGHQVKFPFNYKKVIKGEKAQENLVLQPGDTIVVP